MDMHSLNIIGLGRAGRMMALLIQEHQPQVVLNLCDKQEQTRNHADPLFKQPVVPDWRQLPLADATILAVPDDALDGLAKAFRQQLPIRPSSRSAAFGNHRIVQTGLRCTRFVPLQTVNAQHQHLSAAGVAWMETRVYNRPFNSC